VYFEPPYKSLTLESLGTNVHRERIFENENRLLSLLLFEKGRNQEEPIDVCFRGVIGCREGSETQALRGLCTLFFGLQAGTRRGSVGGRLKGGIAKARAEGLDA
jgi:hypothetical protein